MKLQLTYKSIRDLINIKQHEQLSIRQWYVEEYFKPENATRYPDDGKETFDISEKKIAELKKLKESLEKIKVPAKTITALKNWMDVVESPDSANINSLQSLLRALNEFVKKQPKRWLFIKKDGILQPIAIKEIKYNTKSQDDYANVCLTYMYGYFFGKSENDSYQKKVDYVYFYKGDVAGEEIVDTDLFNEDELNDDETDKPKRKKSATKADKKTLYEILNERGIYKNTPELMKEYEQSVERFYETCKHFGKAYESSGYAYLFKFTSWRDDIELGNSIKMEEDGIKNKIIINDYRIIVY